MEKGALIRVRAYGGKELVRRVVRDLGRYVIVSNPKDYEKAVRQGREPDGIGFRREAVIGPVSSSPR